MAYTPGQKAVSSLVGSELLNVDAGGPLPLTATASQVAGGLVVPLSKTALNTVGAATLTAAALATRYIARGGVQAGAFTDTLDTAANIVAGLPGAYVGQSFLVDIVNNTTQQQTIAAPASIALSGVQQIAQNTVGHFELIITALSPAAATFEGLWIVDRGIDNFNATSASAGANASGDPTVTADSTQGYGVGSLWYNTTAGFLRAWECRTAAAGAAGWIFSGADYANGGTNPPGEVTQFGLGAALMAEEGNINRQISSVGINPGSTGNDNVLAVYSLPASSFDVTGRGITITGQGSFGATGNNKRIKIIFNATTAVVGSAVTGGTAVADTGTVATNGGGWSVQANVFKYGAAASNTQIGLHQQAQVGAAVSALLAPALLTAVESGVILIAVTGNATTATTDIVHNFLEINAMN